MSLQQDLAKFFFLCTIKIPKSHRFLYKVDWGLGESELHTAHQKQVWMVWKLCTVILLDYADVKKLFKQRNILTKFLASFNKQLKDVKIQIGNLFLFQLESLNFNSVLSTIFNAVLSTI